MKKTRLILVKTLLLSIILLSLGTSLFAEAAPLEFLTHINGDEDVKFFNPTGLYQKVPEEVTVLQEDWIIQTGDDSIELTLEEGAMRVGPDTIVAIDILYVDKIEVYVLKGSVRAVSDSAVPISLLTKNNEYSFTTGDFTLLIDGIDEQFFSNDGAANAKSLSFENAVELDSNNTISAGVVVSVEE